MSAKMSYQQQQQFAAWQVRAEAFHKQAEANMIKLTKQGEAFLRTHALTPEIEAEQEKQFARNLDAYIKAGVLAVVITS